MLQNEVRSFTEPAEFSAAIQNAGVELSLSTPGLFTGSVTRVRLHSLHIQRMSINRPFISHVVPRRGRAYITFLTADGASVLRSGMEMVPNTITRFAADKSYFQRALGALCLGAMSLPLEDMQFAGTTAFGCDLTQPPGYLTVTPPPGAMAVLQRLHKAAGMLAEEAPEMLTHPEVARGLEQGLVQAMVSCLNTVDVREDRAAQRRHQKIMNRFHLMLKSEPERAVYVLEIAAAVGTSLRSLSVICREHLGMGPKRYLMLRRMHLARRALQLATPHVSTVTDVATRYGFWQFGRFAGEYNSLFGESPSATLRKVTPGS